ncbi:N-acyl-L-homoserine lactone synthetase [Tropicimonas isoalkanivorans]|uniref:N-acyl-L-homoserine lactone synthetase n=2 Tax=Tropicimonas isoalkanivorans TaxID=441112 RepID=A0A1I1MNX3_9RHOB|nr:N-acyl-L-homoserine lactone synthetase [Tropicimonas isoalkanivorans]
MRNICFSMATMHEHGNAFYEFLRLRKRLFVDTLNWDIPHNDIVEMDEYDNPAAFYSLVLDGERLVGGARTMPVNAVWGTKTSMFQDAMLGKIEGIPSDLVTGSFDPEISWECTRLIIDDSVTGADARKTCLNLIVDGLAQMASDQGAKVLVSLSPPPLQRALRGLGHDVSQIGRTYRCESDGRNYCLLSMPALVSDAAKRANSGGLRAAS